MKITLDPGHGKNSNKGVLSGYYEGTQMFKLAEYLKAELEKYRNVTVYLTKDEVSDNPSLDERGKTAVNNGSELFISLHSNAASDEKAHGVSLFRSVNNGESAELGRKLGAGIASLMYSQTGNTYLRGVFTRTYQSFSGRTLDYYGVIRSSVKGGMKYSFIIEHGFHTNKLECAYLLKEENLKALAKKEAKIIADYFGLVLKGVGEGTESETVYTVQKGDTLSRIAAMYGVSVSEIVLLNGIKNPDFITVGQVLVISRSTATANEFSVGDRVRIKEYKTTYFPDGRRFSSWVHDYDYIVSKIADSNGNYVYRNGDRCVLLGRKINRITGAESSAINSWCSVNYINKV